ncbi:hypothetical protein WAX74_01120 [Psychrobacillus sp. FJAT-51614]|uniref:Uncharacterized protein n=1 Tax=Psychrobacillus mangrovi TaxID=3117745 RepID=A0ABU8EZS0_9BACI
MEQAFSLCALEIDSVHYANRKDEKIKAFFELHVEQGPVLENETKRLVLLPK